jgi:DNA-binding transcriptional MerR regulator
LTAGATNRGRGAVDNVVVMQIGELASESGITTKTIRYYESIGLLDEPQRTSGGYRSYGPDAIERLDFIRQAKASGLTLAEIRSILEIKDEGGQSCDHTRALLAGHLDALDAKIEELHAARAELQQLSERAARLDPAQCTDAHRCQVITAGRA